MERAARWTDGGTPFTREDDVRLFTMIQQAGQLAAQAVEIIFAVPPGLQRPSAARGCSATTGTWPCTAGTSPRST